MTKVLLLLRHAQSADKQSGQTDYDRILSPHGEADSILLGKNLQKRSINIDLIVASAATRVSQTVANVNQSLHLSDEKIQFKRALYECSRNEWMQEINSLDDQLTNVMLAGHNPTLSFLASRLARVTYNLLPGELIGISFDVLSWHEIMDQGTEILQIDPNKKQ